MADEEDEERLPVAVKCEACESNLQSGDRFCSSCGVALNIDAIAICGVELN